MIVLIAALLFDPHVAIENARTDYNLLPAFVCHERMVRYNNNKLHDVVDATVRFSVGRDVYSDIIRKGKHLKRLRDIRGTWSSGEYGSVLKAAVIALVDRNYVRSQVNPDGTVELEYNTTKEESEWYLREEGDGDGDVIPFSIKIVLSRDNRIKSILQVSPYPKPGVREARMEVLTALQNIKGQVYLLPSSAYSETTNTDGSVARNEIRFDDFRKFEVESKLIILAQN